MLLKTETYKHQQSFANYCRDGIEVNIKGAVAERLPNYRRLVYNVVKDSLESAFPISYKYIDSGIWESMIYEYFSTHKCQASQVWRMPFEFYQFTVENNYSKKYGIPYLNNLLWFEWLEVDLYMMEDKPYPQYSENKIWDNQLIAVNPEHQLIKLEYPVHKQKPNEALKNKGDYFLLLFREKDTGKVQFIDLSVLYVFLIENIIHGEKRLNEILNDILYLFGVNDIDLLQKNTHNFFK